MSKLAPKDRDDLIRYLFEAENMALYGCHSTNCRVVPDDLKKNLTTDCTCHCLDNLQDLILNAKCIVENDLLDESL